MKDRTRQIISVLCAFILACCLSQGCVKNKESSNLISIDIRSGGEIGVNDQLVRLQDLKKVLYDILYKEETASEQKVSSDEIMIIEEIPALQSRHAQIQIHYPGPPSGVLISVMKELGEFNIKYTVQYEDALPVMVRLMRTIPGTPLAVPKKNHYQIFVNFEGDMMHERELISAAGIEEDLKMRLSGNNRLIVDVRVDQSLPAGKLLPLLKIFNSLDVSRLNLSTADEAPGITSEVDIEEDATIDLSRFDLEDEPPPPPPPADDEPGIVFTPFDVAPEPVGGFKAIQKNLVYPEIARKAGVEGRVTVWVQIDEKGNVINTKIQQSMGPNGCDEAAINAIKSVQWKPAMNRDRPVKVWIVVPIDFRLQ